MYSFTDYSYMMADLIRMDAYRSALCRAVVPGSVVVDLGAGAGIMSCLAAQLGAGKVYAIEPNNTIQTARAIARANRFERRIVFLQKFADTVTLPEQADVVVADMRGVLPLFGANILALADVRSRLLKPGGILIPDVDTLWVALAQAPTQYDHLVSGWEDTSLDLSIGRSMATCNWIRTHLSAEQLLCKPDHWADIKYRSIASPAICGRANRQVTAAGTAHGLCVWFDANLLDGIGFSNAPGEPKTVYGQGFFPLSRPVQVEPGDLAEIDLSAQLAGEDYIWAWQTAIYTSEGRLKANDRQCSLFGIPLLPETLRRRSDLFVPPASPSAEVDRAILERFGTGRTLRQIASEVTACFPAQLRSPKLAFDRVASLSDRYNSE